MVYVATSSFGSGSACPNATKAARIVVVALPSTAMAAISASESNARNNDGTASTYASNPNVVGYVFALFWGSFVFLFLGWGGVYSLEVERFRFFGVLFHTRPAQLAVLHLPIVGVLVVAFAN